MAFPRSFFSRCISPLFRSNKVTSCGAYLPSSASYSTHFVGDDPILVRDFIHAALYDPKDGYFSQRSNSVGVLEQSIKFSQLEGRRAYLHLLDKIYKQSEVSWFTPVELFKPWYAHGIAQAILRTANLSVPLKFYRSLEHGEGFTRGQGLPIFAIKVLALGPTMINIYEIGGGSGTCAKGIMDYLKLNAPTRVYDNMSYISVEISPSLAEKQIATVREVQSHISKFRVECRDAADLNGWGEAEQQPCWVIMLEVLDNLPHDLIYSVDQFSSWMEVWVEKHRERSELSELYKPVQDRLITSCIEILDLEKATQGNIASSMAKKMWAKVFPKTQRCWLPTGCLKLLEVLHGALPKMSLVASDFSYLPDVKIPGERAPLVSIKFLGGDAMNMILRHAIAVTLNRDGNSVDYNNYLDAKGDADIFFPTDFWLLERMDHYCSGWLKPHEDKSSKKGKKRRTIMLNTSAFMEEFGFPTKTRTRSGYNPLLDDFKNTKIYISVPTHNTK